MYSIVISYITLSPSSSFTAFIECTFRFKLSSDRIISILHLNCVNYHVIVVLCQVLMDLSCSP